MAGYTAPQAVSGSIMLDVAGYATVTGRSIEEVRAMFGFSTYETVGKAECEVDAKGPHAGEVDLGFGVRHRWVKAKAWARCSFTWTGPSYEWPPYIDWRLRMLLVRDPAWWKWWGAYKSYKKRGTPWDRYRVTFRETESGRRGTQVWFTYCENDGYENRVGLWPSVPWPWFVSGLGPAGYDYHAGTVTDC
ncbi:MAG: hypothetical protein OXU77_02620 [Gammaproteobacteria bacterium]|nr:hypothetical protein [Gammaproteobacteria bacterium]